MLTKFVLGKFRHPDDVMASVRNLQHSGEKVFDVYTPFPVHGLDRLMGIKRSSLTTAAFLFGLTGFLCALTMQWYMLAYDWPINFGGKPFFAAPDFVPVCFELTVLFTAFGMVFTFFAVSKLFPGKDAVVFDSHVTDDVFVVALRKDALKNEGGAMDIMRSSGAFEVSEIEADEEVLVSR